MFRQLQSENSKIISLLKHIEMKKITFLIGIGLAVIFTACSGEKTSTDVRELPTAAQEFVSKNFDSKVSHIIIDDDFVGKEYDVILSDGTKVEFNSDGEWDKIEAPYDQVIPAKLVPTPIQEYISKHFEGHSIIKIDRDRNGYEVELQNDLELHFAPNGTFVSIDD